MSSGGMKIGLKGFSPVLDSVFGMRDGSVKQQASADLSTQLLSAGPLANVLASTSGNVVFFSTKAAMDLALDYSAPQAAWVFADPNPANNAVYYFTNGDPGYWSFMLNFPASWIYATVSGGTANEVELSMAGTVSRSTMIFYEVSEDNLGGGVTISVNGSDPMTALDFRGDPLEAGALAEGALAVFFPVGDGTARMIIDNTATAAAAAAAASAASANTSALAASDSAIEAGVSSNTSRRFAIAPEDEETSPGSGLYSAYHWARKAASVVLGMLAAQIVAAATAVPAATDLFAFVDNASGNLKKVTLTNLVAAIIGEGGLATKTGAETLTNKTLTNPTIDGPVPSSQQSIGASVAANALTLTINPNVMDFRSASLTSGTPSRETLANALTLTVPSGATLGTTNGAAAHLMVLELLDGTTLRPAVVNLAGGLNLDETGLISATAISAGATSKTTVYSDANVSNVPYRVVGFIAIAEATAGTWASAPTLVQGVGGQALSALSSLGFGQSWQAVTRTSGTTYYNTTGRPIAVMFQNGVSSNTNVVVNGTSLGGSASTSNTYANMTFIVPPDGSYSLTEASGVRVITLELR